MQINALKIGFRAYDVMEVPQEDMGDEELGTIDLFSGEIRIAVEHPEPFKAEVLIHEILHGLLHDSGISIKREERLVRLLSPRLTAFIADNPTVIDSIQETLAPMATERRISDRATSHIPMEPISHNPPCTLTLSQIPYTPIPPDSHTHIPS